MATGALDVSWLNAGRKSPWDFQGKVRSIARRMWRPRTELEVCSVEKVLPKSFYGGRPSRRMRSWKAGSDRTESKAGSTLSRVRY